MKYYTIQNNSLLTADNKQALTKYYTNVFELPTDYEFGKYVIVNSQLVLNTDWEQEQTQKRQEEFESKFLQTSKGNYRLTPRGYANAQQSIDIVNNMVNLSGSLTEDVAQMVLFYETPDFTKQEECTEEWLINHQYNIEPMTKEEWLTFYIEFTTNYARKMYQQSLIQGE